MKALIVAHASSSYRISPAYAIRRLLQHFGIDADVAVTDDVQAAGGKSYINSSHERVA